MLSNYPPGVSGNEPEIVGYDFDEEPEFDGREYSYWREDVKRFVNVMCVPTKQPTLCFHNRSIKDVCHDCVAEKEPF